MKQAIKILGSIVFFGIIFSIIASSRQGIRPDADLHYSLNGTKDFFEDAHKGVRGEKPQDKIAGLTVNHHLLAANLIAQQFSLIATEERVTVVLISPNHFFRGDGGAISSNLDWQTPYGVLKLDHSVISKLEETGQVNIDERPFLQEHGVSGLVGFIKKSLPNARLVPILIKDNLSSAKAEELAEKLQTILPDNSIVVGSVDFSHYLTDPGAEFHDAASLSVLETFDYERLAKLDVDTRPGLHILLKYMELTGNQKFTLVSNENSATVTRNLDFTETTSYINGYFTAGEQVGRSVYTTIYVPNLPKEFSSPDLWNRQSRSFAFAKSDRLFLYNDLTLTAFNPPNSQVQKLMITLGFNLNQDLSVAKSIAESLKVENELVAIGLLNSQNVTEVWLFPLGWIEGEIVLLSGLKSDTILEQISERSEDPELRKQILNGRIIIK